MPSKVTVTVVLTEEEKNRLKRLADSQDRSLSYLAGKFVREALVRAEDEEIAQAKTRGNLRRERMLAEAEEAKAKTTSSNQDAAGVIEQLPAKPEEKKARRMTAEEFRNYKG